ncbi:MAG: cysteine--tRNA ligase [Anaerolineae bacterium]|nr:cysteine--tRNA ligase [Anaerolineae bacterium]
MTLRVYNYLTREMEVFKPLHEDSVGVYVCGPTVYDHAHLGHAKTYIAMDVILRYLRFRGYKVRYVRNLTDVGHLLDSGEDRISRGANREQLQPMEVVEMYINSFNDDMDTLHVLRPNISPRPTGHIPEIIAGIQNLLDMGYAYEAEGNVYFSVEKFSEYGKLSRHDPGELLAGARVEVREDKQNPADFALWKKAAPEHLMSWSSPWGEGYPGWHIECSVMSTKYLGQPFDIHGGGLENVFPHNECEIAQAEALRGTTFAAYWMLAGSLTVNGVKMSKSLGNFLTIKDALKLYTPEAIRYFILSSHYRSTIDYSREAIEAAQQGIKRLHNTVTKLRRRKHNAAPAGTALLSQVVTLDDYRQDFLTAMDDDFNTPQALATLFEFVKEVNNYLDENENVSMGTFAAMDRIFTDLAGQVLRILPETFLGQVTEPMMEGLLDLLIELRQEYRASRDWTKADMIRSHLSEIGIILEDYADGSTWYLK